MRRIARRLDGDILAVESGRQRAVGNEVVEHSVEKRGILGVKAQTRCTNAGKRAPLAQRLPGVTLAGQIRSMSAWC